MSDYPMLISNKLHSFRNFLMQKYYFFTKPLCTTIQNRRMHFLKINSLATVEALKNDEKKLIIKLGLSRLASFLPFFEVIPKIFSNFA